MSRDPANEEPDAPAARGRRAAATATRLAIALALVAGALAGMGTFTFVYGKGYAYLGNDPATCANCHVMQEHYDAWSRSSHARVAECNDCHLLPHPIGKWITKADNGFFHSLAFTTGVYPDPIRIKPRNRAVTQAACLSCHAEVFHAAGPRDESVLCIHCHTDVGHRHR